LFEIPNICFNTAIKFGGGGPAEGWFAVLGCSLLIFHLNFLEFYCIKEAPGAGKKRFLAKEQTQNA
jgi:hypothetical protein